MVEVVLGWITLGVIPMIYQICFMLPEIERGWKAYLWLLMIGIVFGPINILVTIEKLKEK